MKAVVLTRYGGPEVVELGDVAQPVAGPGEVLVRIKAAGLNPVDFKTRAGMLKVIEAYPLPAVMGNEFAGVVEAVGRGVTSFVPGDRVFARTAKNAMGGLAEFTTIPADLLVHIPPSLDFATAAGIPLAGLTALQALRDEMRVGPGSRVFIPGGAGGVGTFAIQLAKWLGAEVITTASPRGRDLVTRLGADQVIDYTTEAFETQTGPVDAVFDLIGGATLDTAFGIVKPGGIVLSVSALPEPQTALKDLERGPGLAALFWFASLPLRWRAWRHKVRYRFLFMHPSGSELAELAALVASGQLEPIIDRVFPLDQAREAIAYLESGRAKGKVVVRVAD
jgi:alcohol dehydrogenase